MTVKGHERKKTVTNKNDRKLTKLLKLTVIKMKNKYKNLTQNTGKNNNSIINKIYMI